MVCVTDAGEEMWSEGRDGMARMSWILPIDMEDKAGRREAFGGGGCALPTQHRKRGRVLGGLRNSLSDAPMAGEGRRKAQPAGTVSRLAPVTPGNRSCARRRIFAGGGHGRLVRAGRVGARREARRIPQCPVCWKTLASSPPALPLIAPDGAHDSGGPRQVFEVSISMKPGDLDGVFSGAQRAFSGRRWGVLGVSIFADRTTAAGWIPRAQPTFSLVRFTVSGTATRADLSAEPGGPALATGATLRGWGGR